MRDIIMPDFEIENSQKKIFAGVDEAGRGPWAGPVVASAVILPKNISQKLLDGLNDSKKISEKKRKELFQLLYNNPDIKIGVGKATVEEIDEINILQATFMAMKRALDELETAPDIAIIDGNKIPPNLKCEAKAVIKGDAKSYSIAAASIIAKVTRDEIMKDLSKIFPYYGWEKNAGYGTKKHKEGLEKYGVTPHHRKSYKPIIKIMEQKK